MSNPLNTKATINIRGQVSRDIREGNPYVAHQPKQTPVLPIKGIFSVSILYRNLRKFSKVKLIYLGPFGKDLPKSYIVVLNQMTPGAMGHPAMRRSCLPILGAVTAPSPIYAMDGK